MGRGRALSRRRVRASACRGAELVGLEYDGPVRRPRAAARGSCTASSRGTRSRSTEGTRHRPHRAGRRRRGLRARRGARPAGARRRSTRRAASTTTTAGCTGLSTAEAADQIVGVLGETRLPRRGAAILRAPLPALLALRHAAHLARSPTTGSSASTSSASRCSTRTRPSSGRPTSTGKRMDDWLRNMGDWNISRRRYYGLPLPFYPCDRAGTLNVIGSKAELRERATSRARPARGAPPPVDRRRADPLRVRAARRATRVPEVGDVWLDAGIVPFSTLGWQNPEWMPEGYATGAAEGLDRRRPAGSRVLGEVVPGRLGLGDARADPALVLLAALHVGRRSTGRAPYQQVLGYEKLLDEHGREMHRLVGQHDRRGGGAAAHGRRRHALACTASRRRART